MRVCRLQTHQWCFLLCNMLLFHALLFGADLVEEFLLQASPPAYSDVSVFELRERARRLDLGGDGSNGSRLYPISAAQCPPHRDLLVLALVLSAPGNADWRGAVRNTWANQTAVRGAAVRTLFFPGPSPPGASTEALREEAGRHGDLVLGEGSASLGGRERGRLEQVKLALRWVLLFCPRARFVVMATDGVFLNVPALGSYLLSLQKHPEDLYLGRVIHRAAPERNPRKPDYLPPHIYPDRLLPDYCSGPTLLMSQDVVRKVYVASEGILALPLPPEVLIGLCARRAGVVATHSARFSGENHIRYSPCCYNFLFSSAGMGAEDLGVAWRDLGAGKGRSCSVLETYYSLVVCKAMTYLDKLSFLSNGNTTQD